MTSHRDHGKDPGKLSDLTMKMNQVYVDEVPGGKPRTCRVCKKQFTVNGDKACVFHPESFSGETAQRWLPPGENTGGAVIHNFYSCCGNPDLNSPGCCWGRHFTYEDPEPITQRLPGMGIIETVGKQSDED